MVSSTKWINPMFLKCEQSTLQLYRKMTSYPQIFTTKKNTSPYIVLIREDIAFKDCMRVHLGTYTRQHGTSTEHLGQINSSFLSFHPQGHSDCQCSGAKTFSKAAWSKRNTFYPSLPQEAILKIVNNKHSYHEYTFAHLFSRQCSSCPFFKK